MPHLQPAKPFKSYEELLDILNARGMRIESRTRALRKLAQVGYYRLSGFWYPCREICFDENQEALKESGESPWRLKRKDTFVEGTSFNAVFDLYIFDKRLRLLILDALERIEIYVRSIIAHELGHVSPLAYQDGGFVLDRYKAARSGNGLSKAPWEEWLNKQQTKISKSKDECILWHRSKGKEIPFWVAIETWDFGMLTRYFAMLKWKYKNMICDRLGGETHAVLANWLTTLNVLRNKCAHHSRIWNMRVNSPIQLTDNGDFKKIDADARCKMYGLIAITWCLVKTIGPSSDWIGRVEEALKSMPSLPNCSFRAMGFPNSQNLPTPLFRSDS
jgi:Abortive infection bacteriophage resistance protein